MTEKYFEAEMDVVVFPDVDVITTSDIATFPTWTDNPATNIPGDSFLE